MRKMVNTFKNITNFMKKNYIGQMMHLMKYVTINRNEFRYNYIFDGSYIAVPLPINNLL